MVGVHGIYDYFGYGVIAYSAMECHYKLHGYVVSLVFGQGELAMSSI